MTVRPVVLGNPSLSPEATNIQITTHPVLTDTPASIYTSTPFPEKHFGYFQILDTSTPTPTTISVSLNTPTAQPLSKIMLTRADFLASGDGSYIFTDLYNDYFKYGKNTITDVSAELKQVCLIECTKQVWATDSIETEGLGGGLFTYNSKVFITMLRSQSNEGAKKTANNLYNEFSPFEFEYDEEEYKTVNAPIENTKIGILILNSRLAVVETTAIGPIALSIVSYCLTDDGQYDVDIASYFANLQIKKLEQAGINPS
jgi:hypothetical protein